MKLIVITEDRLDELVEKCIDDCFKSGKIDPGGGTLLVNQRTVNYHVCTLKDAIKDGKLGL